MIDEILELLLDIVVEFIPNSVWKVLSFVIGAVATATGIIMFTESPLAGGVLIVVGMLLLVWPIISWYR